MFLAYCLVSCCCKQHGVDSLSSEQSLTRVDPSRNMDAKLENSLLTGPSKESQVSPRGQRNNAWHDVLEICKKGFANKMSTLTSFEKNAILFTPLKMFYWVLKFGSCAECLSVKGNAGPCSMEFTSLEKTAGILSHPLLWGIHSNTIKCCATVLPGSMSDEILAEVRLEVDQSATALRKDVAETRHSASSLWVIRVIRPFGFEVRKRQAKRWQRWGCKGMQR